MLLAVAKSDIGLTRQINEDSFAVVLPHLFIVADGMGGHVAGEIASKMAVTAMKQYLVNRNASDTTEDVLRAAVTEANARIFEASLKRDDYAGMGTTASIVSASPAGFCWAHVGDSRIYLLRGGELKQLTEDHSLVWQLVKNGTIRKEDAQTHPQRNMLIRAVGIEREVVVDSGRGVWGRGDGLLLCTDGLTNMVSEADMLDVLSRPGLNERERADALVAEANAAGGMDNITVVLVKNEI